MNASSILVACSGLLLLGTVPRAGADRAAAGDQFVQGKLTRETIIEQTMKPFAGMSEKGVDRTSLNGKVMCGYQGWHAAEGDGLGRGWHHWTGKSGFKPGSTNVDL